METMVVIGVMTVLLLIVTQMFILNYDIVEKQTGRANNDTGAVLAARSISDTTRGATAVLASRTINGTLYASSSSTLVLQLPTVNVSGNIVAGSSDYVAFYRDPVETTKVFIDLEAAGSSARGSGKRVLTNHNLTLLFRYNDSDITKATKVSVFLQNQQTIRGLTLNTKGWTALFLRNK
jgi:hypothetical protein